MQAGLDADSEDSNGVCSNQFPVSCFVPKKIVNFYDSEIIVRMPQMKGIQQRRYEVETFPFIISCTW